MVLCSCEFPLSNSAVVLLETVTVSKEIDRRHHFQSDLCVLYLKLGHPDLLAGIVIPA